MIRRIIIVLLGLGLLILLFVIIFGGGSDVTKPLNPLKNLADYAQTSAETRFTTDGIVNGDDQHRQIRITVGRDSRTLDVIQGYQGHIIRTKSYSNNQTAYDVFLRSLDLAGFTRERKTSFEDERGVCPLGLRFIYELVNTDDKDNDIRLWSTDCGGGSAAGRLTTIQELFENQISNFDSLTADVTL